MSIPSGVGTATVHIDAPVSYTGDPGRVHINITASVPLVHAASGTPLANFMDSFTPGAGQEMSAQLPWTDQAGFIDGAGNTYTNWSYLAQVTYEKDGQLVVFPDRSFQIPSGQTSVDLALVPAGPSVPAQTAPILPVTSINGRNGAVVLTKTDVGLSNADNTSDVNKPVSTAQQAALDTKARIWRPNTAYLAGDVVISPLGELVKAKATFVSGSSYLASNWASVSLGEFVATRTNLITNPSMETASGTVNVRTNLCTNPNFEVDLAGWAGVGSAVPTITRDTTQSSFGAASLKAAWPTVGANNTAVRFTMNVTAGKTYTMSASVFVPAGQPAVKLLIGTGNETSSASSNVTGTWQRLSVTNTATNTGTGYFDFRPFVDPTSGQYAFIDAVLIEESPVAQPYFDGSNPIKNLIGNPSFETDTSGWAVAGGATLTRDTSRSYSGAASMKVDASAGAAYSGAGYTVSPNLALGLTYTYSAYVWAPSGTSVNFAADALGTNTTLVGNGTWQRVSVTGTAVGQQPFYVRSLGVNQAPFWVDGVMVEPSATASPYYEGSGDFTCVWAGTANASASYQQAPGISNTAVPNNTGAVAWQSQVVSFYGTKSLACKAQGNNGYNGVYAVATGLLPSTTYTFSAWVYLPAAFGNGVYAFAGGTTSGLVRGNAVSATGSWVRTSVTFTTTSDPSPQVTLYVITDYGDTAAAGAMFYTDGWMLEQSSTLGAYFDGSNPIKNLATNPSVETDFTNWSTQWYGPGGAGTWVRSAGTGMDGGYSMRKTWTTAEPAAQDVGAAYTVPVTPGKTYTFSGHMKPSMATNLTPYVMWKSAGFTGMGTFPSPSIVALQVPAPAGVWTRGSVTAVAPPGAAYAAFIWGPYGNAGTSMVVGATLDFDRVLVEESATMNPYYEGTGLFSYAWAGAANASTSQQLSGSTALATTAPATAATNGLMLAADKAKLDAASASRVNNALVLRDAYGAFTTGAIYLSDAPTDPAAATRKDYVDGKVGAVSYASLGVVPNAYLPNRLGPYHEVLSTRYGDDWNNARETGYYMSSTAANSPQAGQWFIGEVMAHNDVYVTQTAIQFTNAQASNTNAYRRHEQNGVWGNWYKLQLSQLEQDNRYLNSPTFTGTVTGITAAMVGLGNVNNTSDANKPVSTAQQAALDAKAPLANPTFTGTVNGISKSMVGLGNVDNTSDANKPLSTVAALLAKGQIGGVANSGSYTGITGTAVVPDYVGSVNLVSGRRYSLRYKFTSTCATASTPVSVNLVKSAPADTTTAGTAVEDSATVWTAVPVSSGSTHLLIWSWVATATETVNLKAVVSKVYGSSNVDLSLRRMTVLDEGMQF